MKTILHPTDFSTSSEDVFRMICPIARDRSAEIIVLHSVCPANCPPDDRDGDQVNRDSPLYQSIWERFARLRQLADDIPMMLCVKVGNPVETIVKVAGHECCDLIALAAPYHAYPHQQYHGSIPDCLKKFAPCPVLCLTESPYQAESKRIIEGLKSSLDECADSQVVATAVGDRNW